MPQSSLTLEISVVCWQYPFFKHYPSINTTKESNIIDFEMNIVMRNLKFSLKLRFVHKLHANLGHFLSKRIFNFYLYYLVNYKFY